MNKVFLSFLFFFFAFFSPKLSLSFCEDSDGYLGLIPQLYIPGTCRDDTGIYDDKCAERIGFYDYDVKEYVCEAGKCVPKQLPCLFPTGGRAPCFTDSQGRGFCKGNMVCRDSDQGKNIFTWGICQELYLGQIVSSFKDKCQDETQVIEYFCLDQLDPSSPPTCQKEIIKCPPNFFCQEGECLQAKCEDTDGGENIFQYGECQKIVGYIRKISPDSCKNEEILIEKVCDGSECEGKEIKCPEGYKCENGACVKKTPEAKCEDTDGGENIFKKGVCRKIIGEKKEEFEDECETLWSVNEKICDLGKKDCISKTLNCPKDYYCENGACVQKNCQDDDGKDIHKVGTCKDNWKTETDICITLAEVKEYFCENGECKSEIIQCPENEICVAGKCEKIFCEDSDGGKNIFEKGVCYEKSEHFIRMTQTDNCFDQKQVNEFFCQKNQCAVEVLMCEPGFICEDGKCVKETCKDEDGEDIYQKGKCSDGSGSFEDVCASENTVKEFVCEKEKCIEKILPCKLNEKCEDGKCVEMTCHETDGGKEKNVYGECMLDGKILCSDECQSETQVKECFCDGKNCNFEILNCEDNEICKNGRCVGKPKEGLCSHLMPCPLGKCNICHFFLLLQRVINCILFGILPPFAILMLVVSGGLYLGNAFGYLPGELETLSTAKRILTLTIFGLVLVYSVWIILNIFLIALGFTQPEGNWWEIKCEIEKTSFSPKIFGQKIAPFLEIL